MSKSATLSLGGPALDYPVISGSIGPDVLDIRKLYARTGAFTFDPGFTSTAACESAITFIDGDEGVLLHRGYSIEQLAHPGQIHSLVRQGNGHPFPISLNQIGADHTPDFAQRPAQGSPGIVGNVPEHLAKPFAAMGPTGQGQVGQQSAGLARWRQGQGLTVTGQHQFPQDRD